MVRQLFSKRPFMSSVSVSNPFAMSGIFVKACPNADGGIILLVVEEHLATKLLHAFVFELWGRDFVRGQPFLPELAMRWHKGWFMLFGRRALLFFSSLRS